MTTHTPMNSVADTEVTSVNAAEIEPPIPMMTMPDSRHTQDRNRALRGTWWLERRAKMPGACSWRARP